MSASVMRVALPVVGAIAGSFVPGLGWKWGLSIGEMAAGLLYPVHTPGPQKDLKIQNYSYGAAIPRVYGKSRIAGSVIWSNGKQAHSHDSGGKGGGGGQQYYTYTSSFAVLVCAGQVDNITRIWADGTLIYDGRTLPVKWGKGIVSSNVRIYPGSSTQGVDPVIQADKGSMTPAFRNRAYVVFQDYDLSNSGNQIPNMEFEVSSSATAVTLDIVVMDICQQSSRTAGSPDSYSLANADFNLTALNAITVDGYCIPTRTPAKDAITNLQDIYHFDLFEVDGVITASLRSSYAAIAITDSDLGARAAEESGAGSVDTARVQITRAQDVEMPRRLDFIYRSMGFDYQPGIQSAMRNVGYSSSLSTLAIPIVLQDTPARAIADVLLAEAWVRRTGYTIRLPYRWYQVAPGDVLSLPGVAGENRLMKVTQVVAGLPGQLVVTGVAYDPDVYTQSATGAALSSSGVGVVDYAGTIFVMSDLPALRPADSAAPGFYVGACGDGTGYWQGASLYQDTGAGYSPIAHMTQQATIGRTNSGLPTGSTNDFDRSSTVNITLNAGTLNGYSESAILNNPTLNACMIGGELLQFCNATLQSGSTYILSDLRRGLKGTPTTGHTSGENFMLLNNAVVRVNLDASQINIPYNYKGVTDGVDPTTVTSYISYTVVGNSLPKLPSAPTGVTAASSVSSVVLSWSSVQYASSYSILRGSASGGPYTHVGSVVGNAYTDTGLTNGTAYYYVVQAVNTIGNSPYSSEVSATPAVNAPTGVTATQASAQVTLNWTPARGVPNYNILRATVSGGPYTTIASAVTGNTYVDTGLTNGTTYYYVVQSVSGATTANSAQVSATPVAATAVPGVPTAAMTAGDQQAWFNVTPVAGATSYNYFRSVGVGNTSYSQIGSSTGFANLLDTALTNGTTYNYYVVAVNSVGAGANSTPINLIPGSVIGEPASPSGVTATSPASGQVQLNWNAVSGATTYSVYRASASANQYVQVASQITGTSFLDTGLTHGSAYYYIIEAVNSAANSVKSSQVSVTP